MNNEIVFIRHAKTKVDKNVPIENWVLTKEGDKSARELKDNKHLQATQVFISSNENKSYLTIKLLADKLGRKIVKIKELGEIARPNSEKMSLEEYEEMKVKIFTDLDYTKQRWESANAALKRFRTAVEKIDKKYENKRIVICAHGTVMTLYFAHLQNKMNELFSRWKALEFGKIGIIKNGKVIRDIV